MPIHLDNIDFKILAALRDDARMTNRELAEKIGLSPSPCLRRVRLLEEAGVIRGYTIRVDQAALGYPVSVFATVRMDTQNGEVLEAFQTKISRCPEVVECYLMTGNSDFLLKIMVSDLPSYERFLKQTLTRIPGVGRIESAFALEQIDHKGSVPF